MSLANHELVELERPIVMGGFRFILKTSVCKNPDTGIEGGVAVSIYYLVNGKGYVFEQIISEDVLETDGRETIADFLSADEGRVCNQVLLAAARRRQLEGE